MDKTLNQAAYIINGHRYADVADAAKAFVHGDMRPEDKVMHMGANSNGAMTWVAGADKNGRRYINQLEEYGSESEIVQSFKRAISDEEKNKNGYYSFRNERYENAEDVTLAYLASDRPGDIVTLHSDYFYGHGLAHVSADKSHFVDNTSFHSNRMVQAFKTSFETLKDLPIDAIRQRQAERALQMKQTNDVNIEKPSLAVPKEAIQNILRQRLGSTASPAPQISTKQVDTTHVEQDSVLADPDAYSMINVNGVIYTDPDKAAKAFHEQSQSNGHANATLTSESMRMHQFAGTDSGGKPFFHQDDYSLKQPLAIAFEQSYQKLVQDQADKQVQQQGAGLSLLDRAQTILSEFEKTTENAGMNYAHADNTANKHRNAVRCGGG